MRPFDMSSLNECNEGKRESDVLVATIEKCEEGVKEIEALKKELRRMKRAKNKAERLLMSIRRDLNTIYELDFRLDKYGCKGWVDHINKEMKWSDDDVAED